MGTWRAGMDPYAMQLLQASAVIEKLTGGNCESAARTIRERIGRIPATCWSILGHVSRSEPPPLQMWLRSGTLPSHWATLRLFHTS